MSILPYSVGMRTARPIGEIEDWLAIHCRGRWDIGLRDVADSLKIKELAISFERADERDAFKAAFAKSGPAHARNPGAAA